MREESGKGPPHGGGSRRGKPNKATSAARQAWALAFEHLVPEAEGWIRQVAKGSPEDGEGPGKATELLLKLAEYHVPKVREPPMSIEAEGGKVTVVVQSYAEEGE